MLVNFDDIETIKKSGFSGFKTIGQLCLDRSEIPKQKGIYLVLNLCQINEFEAIGTGGFFKNKNPNISISELKLQWVDNTIVLYIGKAGQEGKKANLYSRITQFLQFGQGKKIGHWGGRLIWQLKNANNLVVCWKSLLEEDPRKVEAEMIKNFIALYSKRPFANLKN